MLGYIAVLFNLYRTVVVGDLLSSLLEDNNQYANFDNLGFWQTQFNNMVAVAVFFAWIKVSPVSTTAAVSPVFIAMESGVNSNS